MINKKNARLIYKTFETNNMQNDYNNISNNGMRVLNNLF